MNGSYQLSVVGGQQEGVAEPRKVDIASVECRRCEMPNSLDANGLCGHCRVTPRAKDDEEEKKKRRRLATN